MTELGILLQKVNKLEDAENVLRNSLDFQKSKSADEQTFNTMECMAMVLRDRGF
jgi:hypothetical protein